MPIIEFSNLRKSFSLSDGTEVPVLRGIDFSVEKGEFVALMGESGSGKSTLLNIVGFLLSPSDGTYRLDGEDVSRLTDDELSFLRNRKIGFVFQQFHLLPKLTSLQNVTLPAMYSDLPPSDWDAKAESLLVRLGLSSKLSSFPGELSGGQQQRVALARSLMNDPDILLADEPTGNLDSKTTKEILSLLTELRREGKTIVMVTHAQDVAAIADRIVRLKDGRIVPSGRGQ